MGNKSAVEAHNGKTHFHFMSHKTVYMYLLFTPLIPSEISRKMRGHGSQWISNKIWKKVLFVSSRAFSLSTPVENSEATWKKATKCNKWYLVAWQKRSSFLPVKMSLIDTLYAWLLPERVIEKGPSL